MADFECIKSYAPEVFELMVDAEKYLNVDPSVTLIKLRLLGEFLAKNIACSCGVLYEKNTTQYDLLILISDKAGIESEFLYIFHDLRKKGNDAVHLSAGDRRTASQCLNNARKLIQWYHGRFGKVSECYKPKYFKGSKSFNQEVEQGNPFSNVKELLKKQRDNTKQAVCEKTDISSMHEPLSAVTLNTQSSIPRDILPKEKVFLSKLAPVGRNKYDKKLKHEIIHSDRHSYFSDKSRFTCQVSNAAEDSNIQYYIGRRYENGHGVVIDIYQAIEWYQKAAKKGHSEALSALKNLANSGVLEAQFSLGDMFSQLGPKIPLKIISWYFEAAKNGNEEAFLKLQQLSLKGNAGAQKKLCELESSVKNVSDEEIQAETWYQNIANPENSNTESLYRLGRMYELGILVTQDSAQAVKWYQMAAQRGHAEARVSLNVFSKKESKETDCSQLKLKADTSLNIKTDDIYLHRELNDAKRRAGISITNQSCESIEQDYARSNNDSMQRADVLNLFSRRTNRSLTNNVAKFGVGIVTFILFVALTVNINKPSVVEVIASNSKTYTITHKVSEGESLSKIFKTHNISAKILHDIIRADVDKKLKTIIPKQTIKFYIDQDNVLQQVTFHIKSRDFLSIKLINGQYKAQYILR